MEHQESIEKLDEAVERYFESWRRARETASDLAKHIQDMGLLAAKVSEQLNRLRAVIENTESIDTGDQHGNQPDEGAGQRRLEL